MNRKCPQTLDKPILLFGLEMEDIGVLSLVGGVGSIILGPAVPGILSIVGWFVLIEFKKDKPSGYMVHWLYHQGIDFPGLIHPIKKVGKYSVYAKSDFIKKFSLS
jgi:hypothetical protein